MWYRSESRPLTCFGRKYRILCGSVSVVAESVVILHGFLCVVAQSAEAYGVQIRFATSDLWWLKV